MTQLHFPKVSQARVQALRARYTTRQVAPLDGMWMAFAEMADAHAIHLDHKPVGFCAVNDDRQLLQFYVEDDRLAASAFAQALATLEISGAVAATCDPMFLSLCLDHQTSTRVQALMYRVEEGPPPPIDPAIPEARFALVERADLSTVVDFGAAALGADPAWLRRYYADLIGKRWLFGLWLDEALIAAGECRPSALQPPHADIGMVVAEDFRGRGVASDVLRRLRHHCVAHDLRAICTTNHDNLPAQGAIANAGFVSQHRLLVFGFDSLPSQP